MIHEKRHEAKMATMSPPHEAVGIKVPKTRATAADPATLMIETSISRWIVHQGLYSKLDT